MQPAQPIAAPVITAYGPWDDSGYLLCVGDLEAPPPPPPSWRTFLHARGALADPSRISKSELALMLDTWGVSLDDLDSPTDELAWETYLDMVEGPAARAYHLLQGLPIGPDLGGEWRGLPHLRFADTGYHPGDESVGVHASCDEALELLQQRLASLNTAITVRRAGTSTATRDR
jgi:hypothetical protein